MIDDNFGGNNVEYITVGQEDFAKYLGKAFDLVNTRYAPLRRAGRRVREIARWIGEVYIGDGKMVSVNLYQEHNALILWCGHKISEAAWDNPIPVKLHADKGSLRIGAVIRGFDFMGLEDCQTAKQQTLYGV